MLLIGRLIAALPFLAAPAFAYEYPLQFMPAAGGRDLVVAGYQITGPNVIGNCSYDIVTSGSGKGGGYKNHTTYYYQTCTWDLSGKLLSVLPERPLPSQWDRRSAYRDVTPERTALLPNHGFVDGPSSHWWEHYSPPGRQLNHRLLSLTSDGDMLYISEVAARRSPDRM